MAVLQYTNKPSRHIFGDSAFRHYDLSGTNGDTFTPPQSAIEFAVFTPSTAIAVGLTISNGVVTFVTSGAFAGSLAVWSRKG